MANPEMRDDIDALRCRLKFLSYAMMSMFERGERPCDEIVAGILYAFHDCEDVLDRLDVELQKAA